MLWTIVVAGGSGARLGGVPKQFRQLAGTAVLVRSVRAVAPLSDGVVVVADPVRAAAAGVAVGTDSVAAVVPGGSDRSASVAAGLECVPDEVDVIAVHDAARPLATTDLLARCVTALGEGIDAVVPGLPVVDTVKEVDAAGSVVRTLARDRLVAVQTPQVFRAAALRRAHVRAGGATDDSSLVEAMGARVVVVAGEPGNVKLTWAEDFAAAERTLGPA